MAATETPPLNCSQSTLPTQPSGKSTQTLSSSIAADNATSTETKPSRSTHDEDSTYEEDDPYPHGVHLATIILGLVLTMLLVVMDMTILATAIPPITDQFHSLDDVGWYGSVFFMTVASSQSTWGKAYKYFDLKTVFLLTIFIFEVGSLICGVAQNSATLIAGRAVTGYGAAGVLAGCYTIVGLAVSPEKRPAFAGVLAATYGVASSIGPVIGGVLTDRVSWRWCFYINLPVGGVSAVIILLTFKTPPMARTEADANAPWTEKLRQMDLVGTCTIMAGVCCLLLALQWGGVSKAWSSADVIGTLVGFGLITIAFLAIEYIQGDRALLVPHILKKKVNYMGCIVSFFLGGAEFTLIYYIPIYFQSILGTTAQDSGVRNLAFIIALTIFTVISGGAITATGYFTPFAVIGAAIATIGSGLMYTWSQTTSAGGWIGYQVIAGTGMGLCFQAPIMAGQALSAPEDVSATTAMLLFFQTMGGAFMVSSAQAGFTNTLVKRLAVLAPSVDPQRVIAAGATRLHKTFVGEELEAVMQSYVGGLKVVFVIIMVLSGCGMLLSVGLPWVSIKNRAHEDKERTGEVAAL